VLKFTVFKIKFTPSGLYLFLLFSWKIKFAAEKIPIKIRGQI
jgi:hypothetical protein